MAEHQSSAGTEHTRHHDLKCWPEFFEALIAGKPFELRNNDRDFRVGDELNLREYDPATREFSGRVLVRKITYILGRRPDAGCAATFGLQPGYVILGIASAAQAVSEPFGWVALYGGQKLFLTVKGAADHYARCCEVVPVYAAQPPATPVEKKKIGRTDREGGWNAARDVAYECSSAGSEPVAWQFRTQVGGTWSNWTDCQKWQFEKVASGLKSGWRTADEIEIRALGVITTEPQEVKEPTDEQVYYAARKLALSAPGMYEDASHKGSLRPNTAAITVSRMMLDAAIRMGGPLSRPHQRGGE